MSAQFKNIIKYTIALAAAALLFWLAVRKMDFAQMVNDVRQADFNWIAITVIISLFSHLARAARWNLLLKPLGFAPKLMNTFLAVMIGYFANIFVPRMGEVSRCAVLNKTENVHFNSAFGTVVAERVFDLICLMLLIGLSFVLEYQRFSDFFFNYLLKSDEAKAGSLLNNPIIYLGLGFILIVLIIAFLYRRQLLASSLYAKVKTFILGLIEGALSIRKLDHKDKALFLLHTFLIWFGYYLMTYLMFFSLPYTSGLDPIAGLVILIAGSLGMSAPVQGGKG